MWFLERPGPRYQSVASDELTPKEDESVTTRDRNASPMPWEAGRGRAWSAAMTVLILFLMSIVMAPVVIYSCKRTVHCAEPVQRREWRQLEHSEKSSYIQAVQCLHGQPSKINPGGRLSDDFSWVHQHIGSFSHNAAPFLAWHRYLIHLYETALRESCGYTGHLTYWDWTLDSTDPPSSPIWDPETGFGGDGDPDSNTTVGFGSCIQDGPFADYEVRYYNLTDQPHCLSRGFGRNDDRPHFNGSDFSPAAIETMFRDHDTFYAFSISLEAGPHNAIPNSVCGDFFLFEAPNDPVFFLHHTQLDRLWWQWQQDSPSRMTAYNGPSRDSSSIMATLDDTLPMRGLGRDVAVAEIMNTQGGLLCYRY